MDVKFLFMKNDKRTTFATNLIRFRKEKGLSQEELANLSGLSRRTIAYYETKATNPPIEKLEALSKTLSVSINNLLGNTTITQQQNIFSQADARTLKRLEQILLLSPQDRHFIYKMIDNILKNKKVKNLSRS